MSTATRARVRRGANNVPAPVPIHDAPHSDRTVDLALAVRIAAMDRLQLEALCAKWGVHIPARASKARLAELLFTRASEPRPPATVIAQSHPPAHLDACTATSMRNAQDAVRIVALRLADVPAHARPEGELLTMLHVSKACLVCQEWKQAFSDPRLRSSLDCTELTGQRFLYELRRFQCI